jgi:ATP-dependent Clp protease ATP-binding subunit ClpC
MMFERYTDRARRVLVLAQEDARLLNHSYVGTEHLLLGLIAEEGGVATQALQACGLTLEAARRQTGEIIGHGHQPPCGPLVFTPRMKKVLELAIRESLLLGNSYIATEHLLLGLIREGEGVGAKVIIHNLDCGLEGVREKVLDMLRGYAEHEHPRVREERPVTLDDVMSALGSLGDRLGAIERRLGIDPSATTPDTED